MRTSDSTCCDRCPKCRSSDLRSRSKTNDYRCIKCAHEFPSPFNGTKHERVKTNDAARVALPRTIGRGTRW